MTPRSWFRTAAKLATAALTGLLLALPAQASPLNFFFDANSGADLSFTLDSNPTPDDGFPGIYFQLSNVNVLVGGVAANAAAIRFFVSGVDGGFNVSLTSDPALFPEFDTTGAQLFTGTLDDPTFKLGTFTLAAGFAPGSVGGTLTISAVAEPEPTVPEPATLALLGVALAGAAVARRKRG